MNMVWKQDRELAKLEFESYDVDLEILGTASLMQATDKNKLPVRWLVRLNGQQIAEYPCSLPVRRALQRASEDVQRTLQNAVK
jgi:hypothetical protein